MAYPWLMRKTISPIASGRLRSALAGSTGCWSGKKSSQLATRMKNPMLAARGRRKAGTFSPTVSRIRFRT